MNGGHGPISLDQETRWLTRYHEVNRKKMNAGELPESRLGKFKELLALVEENKRRNQYV